MNVKRALTIILIVVILALGGYFVFKIMNKPTNEPGIIQNLPGLKRTIVSGKVISVSSTEIAVSTDVGVEKFNLDEKTQIVDDKGNPANLTYLAPGISVGVTNKDNLADSIVISELPPVIISAPQSLTPVNISFNVEGYIHPTGDGIKVSV